MNNFNQNITVYHKETQKFYFVSNNKNENDVNSILKIKSLNDFNSKEFFEVNKRPLTSNEMIDMVGKVVHPINDDLLYLSNGYYLITSFNVKTNKVGILNNYYSASDLFNMFGIFKNEIGNPIIFNDTSLKFIEVTEMNHEK
jgi:hypothetical protein